MLKDDDPGLELDHANSGAAGQPDEGPELTIVARNFSKVTYIKMLVTQVRITEQVFRYALADANVRRTSAPMGLERILTLLVPADRQEEVLGDFEENLQFVAERQGPRWARFWYGCQVTWYAIGRLVAFAGHVGDAIGKLWKPV